MRTGIAILWLPLAAALGQSFDVASVKPSTDEGPTLNINLGAAHHGTVTLTNTTLSECIRFAYELVSEEQISGPDWIRDRKLRVDIVAKAPPDTPHEQLLRMTQALLAERFKLELHREPKVLQHYELSLGKGAPKVVAAKGDGPSFSPQYRRGVLHYSYISMHTFAVLLSRQLKQVVIDNTGLRGMFDVNLDWTPDEPAPPPSRGPDASSRAEIAAESGAPGIFKAVQQQLGLTLEAKKTPIDVLVVDRAEKAPIGN